MIANCLNCNSDFTFFPSQSDGKFCCRKCSGEYITKQNIPNRLKENTVFEKSTRKYVLLLKGESCECCGISEWQGKKLSLHIDHINGIRTDNRIENLKVLCPNCHSQTPTFGVKNVSEDGRKRMNAGAVKGSRTAAKNRTAKKSLLCNF